MTEVKDTKTVREHWYDIDRRLAAVREEAWAFRIECAPQEIDPAAEVSPAYTKAQKKVFPVFDQEFWDARAAEQEQGGY